MRFFEDIVLLFVLILGFFTSLFFLLDMLLDRRLKAAELTSRRARPNEVVHETWELFCRLVDYAEHLLAVQERIAVRVTVPTSLVPVEPQMQEDPEEAGVPSEPTEMEEEEGEVESDVPDIVDPDMADPFADLVDPFPEGETGGELEEEEEGGGEEEGEVEDDDDLDELFKPSPDSVYTVADMFHKLGFLRGDEWGPLSKKSHDAISEYLESEPEEPTSNHPWSITDDKLVRSTILSSRHLREFVKGVELPEPAPFEMPMPIPKAVPKAPGAARTDDPDPDDSDDEKWDDIDEGFPEFLELTQTTLRGKKRPL